MRIRSLSVYAVVHGKSRFRIRTSSGPVRPRNRLSPGLDRPYPLTQHLRLASNSTTRSYTNDPCLPNTVRKRRNWTVKFFGIFFLSRPPALRRTLFNNRTESKTNTQHTLEFTDDVSRGRKVGDKSRGLQWSRRSVARETVDETLAGRRKPSTERNSLAVA